MDPLRRSRRDREEGLGGRCAASARNGSRCASPARTSTSISTRSTRNSASGSGSIPKRRRASSSLSSARSTSRSSPSSASLGEASVTVTIYHNPRCSKLRRGTRAAARKGRRTEDRRVPQDAADRDRARPDPEADGQEPARHRAQGGGGRGRHRSRDHVGRCTAAGDGAPSRGDRAADRRQGLEGGARAATRGGRSASSNDRGPRPSLALLVAASLCWAGNWVVSRGIRETMPPIALSFFRWLVVVVLLAPIALPALRGTGRGRSRTGRSFFAECARRAGFHDLR